MVGQADRIAAVAPDLKNLEIAVPEVLSTDFGVKRAFLSVGANAVAANPVFGHGGCGLGGIRGAMDGLESV